MGSHGERYTLFCCPDVRPARTFPAEFGANGGLSSAQRAYIRPLSSESADVVRPHWSVKSLQRKLPNELCFGDGPNRKPHLGIH